MFVILAVFIVLSSLATVLTKSIVRAATYLLFVLLGTAGLYFLMGYTFLGAVQVMVYAGGIIVLYAPCSGLRHAGDFQLRPPA